MTMIQETPGKLTAKEQKFAAFLNWAPGLALLLLTLPPPIVFLVLFLTSATTEAAAVFLFLAAAALGLGFTAGIVALVVLLIYRNRWLRSFRNKLAADGITSREVDWFIKELTTAERKALRETRDQNVLLGDAYRETLAARLTATRMISKTSKELARVRTRINRARVLPGAEASTLLADLEFDRQELEKLKGDASDRLLRAKARLQTIEAASSRALNQAETSAMLRRLSATQDQLPLVIEMEKLERKTLQEAEIEMRDRDLTLDQSRNPQLKP